MTLREHLASALRAEAAEVDLQYHNGRIHVYAMRPNGNMDELGSVCALAAAQDPEFALSAIDRIRLEWKSARSGRVEP